FDPVAYGVRVVALARRAVGLLGRRAEEFGAVAKVARYAATNPFIVLPRCSLSGRPRARRDPRPEAPRAHGRLRDEARHPRLFRSDSAHGRDLRFGNPETRSPPGRLLGRVVRPVPPGRADPRAGRERARGDP